MAERRAEQGLLLLRLRRAVEDFAVGAKVADLVDEAGAAVRRELQRVALDDLDAVPGLVALRVLRHRRRAVDLRQRRDAVHRALGAVAGSVPDAALRQRPV